MNSFLFVRSLCVGISLFCFSYAEVQVEILLDGLSFPTGLAIRPDNNAERNEVFIAERGKGRVVRYSSDEPEAVREVITGFHLGNTNEDPSDQNGLAALGFLNSNRLLVCGGGTQDDGQHLSVFDLPKDGSLIFFNSPKKKVKTRVTDALHTVGEYGLCGLTSNTDAVYVTSLDKSKRGMILKARRRGPLLEDLQQFIKALPRQDPGLAVAAAINPTPDKQYLAIGQIGKLDRSKDSQLVFYNPIDGQLLMSLKTNLYDLIGLAYSPKTGQLYGIDFAFHNRTLGGVYRLDSAVVDDNPGCRAVLIHKVVCPISLAFTPKGAMLVATYSSGDDLQQATGTLIKLTDNL